MPFGMEKLEWYGYPMVKKTLKMLKILKIRFDRMYERDTHTHTHTDGHRMTAKAALDANIARQKSKRFVAGL